MNDFQSKIGKIKFTRFQSFERKIKSKYYYFLCYKRIEIKRGKMKL